MNRDLQNSEPSQTRAWLVASSGPRTGFRYPVSRSATRVGRGQDNDVVVDGPEAPGVSLHHFEICREASGFRIRDLGSTNGTFLDGRPIDEADLSAPATIRLGTKGPEFRFEDAGPGTEGLNKTVRIAEADVAGEPQTFSATYDGLLSDAVAQARHARAKGLKGETMGIMRDALHRALRSSGKRSRRVIHILAAVLVAVSGLAGWKIWDLHRSKSSIDRRIQEIESQLQQASGGGGEADRLITQLDAYQGEARQLQRHVLYRIAGSPEDFVTGEIRTLMAEFGAEVYSVPTEFADRIKHYLDRYQGIDRPVMAHALGGGERKLRTVREILLQEQLPADLAYIPVVESALAPDQLSSAGAAGPWQFTPATARGFGLRVDKNVDERHDLNKSTRAGCRYLRELILDFGSGSSVMLALAAYNSGPTKVKQAVMKNVRDPIKQRNFWYLYRTRALPEETREYVPKVVAVMIIGRNARHFGFETGSREAAGKTQ